MVSVLKKTFSLLCHASRRFRRLHKLLQTLFVSIFPWPFYKCMKTTHHIVRSKHQHKTGLPSRRTEKILHFISSRTMAFTSKHVKTTQFLISKLLSRCRMHHVHFAKTRFVDRVCSSRQRTNGYISPKVSIVRVFSSANIQKF